jgi:hypothetical protein
MMAMASTTAVEAWDKRWTTAEGRADWLDPDFDVMALLPEQPPKLRLWSEAHGSIRVQEGEPNLSRAVVNSSLFHEQFETRKLRSRRFVGVLVLRSCEETLGAS